MLLLSEFLNGLLSLECGFFFFFLGLYGTVLRGEQLRNKEA